MSRSGRVCGVVPLALALALFALIAAASAMGVDHHRTHTRSHAHTHSLHARAATFEEAQALVASGEPAPFHTVIHIARCAGHQTTELVLTNGRWSVQDVIDHLETKRLCCGAYQNGDDDANVSKYQLYLSGQRLDKAKPWLWYIYQHPSLHTGVLKCVAPYQFDPIFG